MEKLGTGVSIAEEDAPCGHSASESRGTGEKLDQTNISDQCQIIRMETT